MSHPDRDVPAFWRSPAGVALWVGIAGGGFYLLTEHTAHVFGALPYFLLLACPLRHVFMHRGHGSDYGLWGLVLVNSIIFIGFACAAR